MEKKEMICIENIKYLLTKDIDKCMEIKLENDLHIINVKESNNGTRTPHKRHNQVIEEENSIELH